MHRNTEKNESSGTAAAPQKYLYFGTTSYRSRVIREEGIAAKEERHTVLRRKKEEALKDASTCNGLFPVVLVIDAERMAEDGYVFQTAAEGVRCCKDIPRQYIDIEPDSDSYPDPVEIISRVLNVDRQEATRILREDEEYEENKGEYLRDTLDLCRNDPGLQKSVDHSVAHSLVFRIHPENTDCRNKDRDQHPLISVLPVPVIDALMTMAESPDRKTAFLNFIHVYDPKDQLSPFDEAVDETIYLCSTLYPCLERIRSGADAPFARDEIVAVPGIQIIKQGKKLPERLTPEEHRTADAITCAAPEYEDYRSFFSSNRKSDSKNLTAEWRCFRADLYRKKARSVIQAAVRLETNTLIIGSWGYGVHEDEYALIAEAYRCALEECGTENLEHVVFALKEGTVSGIYRSFREVFNVRQE